MKQSKAGLVPINKIVIKDRMRIEYENIESLSISIGRLGLIQNVIVDENLNLLAGGRRLKAAELAGLKEVPVTIRTGLTDVEKLEVEIDENLYREDLTYAEEVAGRKRIQALLLKLHGNQAETGNRSEQSVNKTAQALGISAQQLHRDLQLADAIEKFPALSKCRNKSEAHKLLNKMCEEAVVDELKKRTVVQKSTIYKYASDHYRVGDAIEGLLNTGPTMAAIAEVDPPYAIDLMSVKKGKAYNEKEQLIYNEIDQHMYPDFLGRTAKALYNVLAKDAWVIWWFGQQYYQLVYEVLLHNGFSVDPIPNVWVKPSGQTNQPDIYQARCTETFFVARKGRPIFHKRGATNAFCVSPVPDSRKIHETEKPMELMTQILDIFTFPGMICIVPFLGSGVTLRTCYKLGLRCFGWEKSSEYKERFLTEVSREVANGIYE